jgi:hypothetical protein
MILLFLASSREGSIKGMQEINFMTMHYNTSTAVIAQSV